MKKTLLLFIAIFSAFFLNSCREDGDWGKNQTNGQFGYTVDRDKDFIEKAVGETTDIKFNIKANYDFGTVPMVIKYSGDLNGVLKLGDITLEQNKEYELKSANNILKYTGNEAGTHKLKISVKNSKDQSKTEEFELKYAVTDFQVSFTGGTTDYYQGQTIDYNGKITPAKNTDTKGYFIKFNTYEGSTILYNGAPVELGKEYSIADISNLKVSTVSNKAGSLRLTYTIKNSTVSRDLELQQNVKQRNISFESVDLSTKSTASNTDLSIIGILKKLPFKDNNNIKYKTWVTSATNNNVSGIITTNNLFVDYSMSDNGDFKIPLKAKDVGSYKVNLQMQDEFGNLSEIKQFDLEVRDFSFTETTSGTIGLEKIRISSNYNYYIRELTIANVSAIAKANNTIVKVVFDVSAVVNGVSTSKSYTYNVDKASDTFTLNNFNYQFPIISNEQVSAPDNTGITETKVKVTIYDNQGNTINQVVNVNYTLKKIS